MDPVAILLVFAFVKVTAGLVILGFLLRSNRDDGDDEGFRRGGDPPAPLPLPPSRRRARSRRGGPERLASRSRGYRRREPLRG